MSTTQAGMKKKLHQKTNMLKANFPITFPTIALKRVLLSQPLEKDVRALVKLLGSSKTYARNTLNIPYPYEQKDGTFWVNLSENSFEKKEALLFAVRLKDTEELIGGVGIHLSPGHNKAELGYWIGAPFWRQGYALEVINGIVDYSFSILCLNKLFAHVFSFNTSSSRLLEKAGFTLEAVLKEEYFKDNTAIDANRYYLLRSERKI